MSTPASPTELLTAEEAARLLRVKVQTLAAWRYTARYPLRWIRCGRSVRYRRSDVLEFLNKQTVTPSAGGGSVTRA